MNDPTHDKPEQYPVQGAGLYFREIGHKRAEFRDVLDAAE